MQLLADGAEFLGIYLSEVQLGQFELYFRELTGWNRRANLTAITGYEDTQVKHFLDSLTVCLPFVDGHQDGDQPVAGGLAGIERVVDIGSGAGFPGLPLKLAFPRIELHLIESVGKKTAFLQHIVQLLELEGVVVHHRPGGNPGASGWTEGVLRPRLGARSGQAVTALGVRPPFLLREWFHGRSQARRSGGRAGWGGVCALRARRENRRGLSRHPGGIDRQSRGGGL